MPDDTDRDATADVPDQEMLRKLHRVVLKIPMTVIVADAEGIIEFVNPKFTDLTGYGADEALGRSLWEVQFARTNTDIFGEVKQMVVAHEEWHGEMANWKKNGALYWESVSVSAVKNDSGTLTHFVLLKEDITERKRTEEKLFESEERFQAFMDNNPAVAWIKDEGGRYIYVNRSFRERFAGDDEWRGKATFEVWPEETSWQIRENDRQVFSTGRPLTTIELLATRGDNRNWWWNFRFPFRNALGKIHLGGIGIDITEQKLAEEALRDSQLRYRTLFDSIEEGFCIIELIFDENGKPVDYRFLETNKAFDKQAGLLDAQGKRMREFAPDHEEHWFEIYGRVATTGEPARFQNKAEQLHRWYDVYAFRFGAPENRQVAVLFSDVTYRKQAEDEQKRLISELERSNRELEQFASAASHDLQEPLRMISGFMQLLDRKYKSQLDEKAETYINYAVDGAKRMQKLIEGLLNYSRISRGAEFGPVNMNAQFAGALANLDETVGESEGTVTAENLPTVQGDETQLLRLFQNLIANALKYRKPGVPPRVHVGVRRDENEWIFSVSDNGIGIHRDHHDSIFQIFQRLHTREEYPGTGIGLAACKKIVERHHGRIWLESEPGVGSTFYFSLPGTSEGST